MWNIVCYFLKLRLTSVCFSHFPGKQNPQHTYKTSVLQLAAAEEKVIEKIFSSSVKVRVNSDYIKGQVTVFPYVKSAVQWSIEWVRAHLILLMTVIEKLFPHSIVLFEICKVATYSLQVHEQGKFNRWCHTKQDHLSRNYFSKNCIWQTQVHFRHWCVSCCCCCYCFLKVSL